MQPASQSFTAADAHCALDVWASEQFFSNSLERYSHVSLENLDPLPVPLGMSLSKGSFQRLLISEVNAEYVINPWNLPYHSCCHLLPCSHQDKVSLRWNSFCVKWILREGNFGQFWLKQAADYNPVLYFWLCCWFDIKHSAGHSFPVSPPSIFLFCLFTFYSAWCTSPSL